MKRIPRFDDVSHLCRDWPFATTPPICAYRSQCMQWTVQVFREDGWLRVGIRKNKADNPRQPVEIVESWEFIQGIKEQLFPGRTAIEFYPNLTDVVDQAPMRWMFVAPKGYQFPCGLGDKVTA